MYFTSLPDHSAPGFDEQAHFRRFREQNIVFNALADKSQCDRHTGCLSIKSVGNGEEWYGVDGRWLAVRPGQFLILNNDQEYASRIHSQEKVRVQSIFFQKEFAASVLRDARMKETALLETPQDPGAAPLEFFQTLYGTTPELERCITAMIGALDANGYDQALLDEHLVFLLRHLISVHKLEQLRSRQVEAIRPSTRTEIYRRLCIAKDWLHSGYMQPLSLAATSQAACLSTPQLVRQFKAVFGKTPHQYLIALRLEHARQLLKNTGNPIHEITWQCGFENTSAFCRAFRLQYGVSPARFRQAV